MIDSEYKCSYFIGCSAVEHRKLLKFVMDFVEEVQVHGLKYLSKSKHRWQWALIMLTFAVCSVIVLWIWLERYLENPTYIVLVESKNTEKPFPAVVVCPEIAFPSHQIEYFVTKLNYPSGFTADYLRKVLHQLAAFFSPDMPYRLADLENIERILDYNDVDIATAGLNLTASCEQTITRCRWRGRIVDCSSLFEMTLTLYGFCCVFNGRSLKRDMMDLQLRRKEVLNEYYGNFDLFSGLMLVINQSLTTPFDVDISYKWLTLHGSQRYVDLPGNGTPITPGTELFAEYSSTGLQVDDEAVNLNRDLRRCRMSYETLKYYPMYHKYHFIWTLRRLRKYCLMESEMQRTLEVCGCLKVGHLRLPGVPVCRARDLQCAKRTTVSIGETNEECPVTCDVELDHTKIATYDLIQDITSFDSFYDDLEFQKVSVVRIYVMNRHKKIFTRKPYFTKFDLFAQLGGVFNIFFGCSVLSSIELVFLLRRVLCKSKGSERRAGISLKNLR